MSFKRVKIMEMKVIIPPDLFGIIKRFIPTEIPYSELSEIQSKQFLMKFHKFTDDCFTVVIT